MKSQRFDMSEDVTDPMMDVQDALLQYPRKSHPASHMRAQRSIMDKLKAKFQALRRHFLTAQRSSFLCLHSTLSPLVHFLGQLIGSNLLYLR